MDYMTTVRLLMRESRNPLANVKVELFDRDEHSADDSLGVAHTNQFGEAVFRYTTRDFADSPLGTDDEGLKVRGDHDTVPDLYAVVYDSAGKVVTSQREAATQNKAAQQMLVLIDDHLVQAHQLGMGD